MEPKVTKREPKGAEMEPKGAKREPRSAKREPKGSPRVTKNASKNRCLEKVAKRRAKNGDHHLFLEPFWDQK